MAKQQPNTNLNPYSAKLKLDAEVMANALLEIHHWAAKQAALGNEDASYVFQHTGSVYFSALRRGTTERAE